MAEGQTPPQVPLTADHFNPGSFGRRVPWGDDHQRRRPSQARGHRSVPVAATADRPGMWRSRPYKCHSKWHSPRRIALPQPNVPKLQNRQAVVAPTVGRFDSCAAPLTKYLKIGILPCQALAWDCLPTLPVSVTGSAVVSGRRSSASGSA